MAITKAKLEKFIRIRNKSEFQTNLQFQFDLTDAGLDLADIGQAYRVGEHGELGYRWDTAVGSFVEHPGGRCELV